MQLKTIGLAIDAVETGTGVLLTTSPFMEGRDVTVIVNNDAFNGSVKLQSSPDNSTWTDISGHVYAEAGSDRTVMKSLTLPDRYIRYNCTARSAGEVDIQLAAAP